MDLLPPTDRSQDVSQPLDRLSPDETLKAESDQLRGTIPGVDFQRALLAIWLGEHPADASLKRGLLGQDKRS